MGGEGPYLRFNESGAAWTMRDPYPLGDEQLDETYARAHAFLLERVQRLVELNWEHHDTDGTVSPSNRPHVANDDDHTTDDLLVSLSFTRAWKTDYGSHQNRVELRLPRTASAWFEPRLVPRWKEMFENQWNLFDPRKRRRSDSTPDRYADAYLYVDVEAPLRDIFNFLQCLIPDVLVIIRIDDYSDFGEEEITQRLPSSKWVEDYAEELRPIFGEERFRSVLQASQEWACLSRRLSSYREYEYESDSFGGDFTACDKECGYCGRCPY